jgi:hypothetical protein
MSDMNENDIARGRAHMAEARRWADVAGTTDGHAAAFYLACLASQQERRLVKLEREVELLRQWMREDAERGT